MGFCVKERETIFWNELKQSLSTIKEILKMTQKQFMYRYQFENGISNAKFASLHGQIFQEPLQVFLERCRQYTKECPTASIFSDVFAVLNGSERGASIAEPVSIKFYNPFQDGTTIMDGVMLTEIGAACGQKRFHIQTLCAEDKSFLC